MIRIAKATVTQTEAEGVASDFGLRSESAVLVGAVLAIEPAGCTNDGHVDGRRDELLFPGLLDDMLEHLDASLQAGSRRRRSRHLGKRGIQRTGFVGDLLLHLCLTLFQFLLLLSQSCLLGCDLLKSLLLRKKSRLLRAEQCVNALLAALHCPVSNLQQRRADLRTVILCCEEVGCIRNRPLLHGKAACRSHKAPRTNGLLHCCEADQCLL
mmetsp:Transcript_16594/g.31359  ORF Transcript_16594/g.31359 Transcript_16594/m.31359 type:complete len:211 (-) Transcript_16594:7-639(-)